MGPTLSADDGAAVELQLDPSPRAADEVESFRTVDGDFECLVGDLNLEVGARAGKGASNDLSCHHVRLLANKRVDQHLDVLRAD